MGPKDVPGLPESVLSAWQFISLVAAAPATGVMALGIWTIWRHYFPSKNDTAGRALTHEQQLQKATLDAGTQASEATKWVVAEAQRELAEERKDKDRAWGEVDRWRRIATHWYWCFREIVHDNRGLQQKITIDYERMDRAGILPPGATPPVWPPAAGHPGIEDPHPPRDKQAG